MNRTLFKVSQMDCAAEESLIRMKLDSVAAVKVLDFDLSQRELTVFHEGEPASIDKALEELKLGSSLLETNQADDVIAEQTVQRNLLWIVLIINGAFFAIEMTTGLISRSMGLVADSMDMLADALVYSLSLIAVGTTVVRKKQIAKWSGYFQLGLAAFGFLEVLRRFFGFEALPDFRVMIVVSILALIANAVCLYLLQRSKSKEAHMKASMIFTSNDIVINLGVIVAGVLVSWLNTGLPDLIIGTIVFTVVIRGAFRILKLSK